MLDILSLLVSIVVGQSSWDQERRVLRIRRQTHRQDCSALLPTMQNQANNEDLNRLQSAFALLENDLKDTVFRPLAKSSFQCATDCCTGTSIEELEPCITKCTNALQMYQQIVQSEVKTFQDRLRRCQMNCNEEMRDRVPSHDLSQLSDNARQELEKQMLSCSSECFRDFRQKIPSLHSRIKSQSLR